MRTLLSHETGAAIRAFIVDNRLKPGDPLPSEAELAALLDVGKTSVREGLRRLEAHGVVEVRRGKGLFVGAFSFGPLIEQLPYGLQTDSVPLAQLLQTRRALEEGLIGEVAKVITDEELKELDGLVDEMRANVEHGRVPAEVDQAFHQALFAPLGNPFVLQLIDVFWTIFRKASDHVVLDLRRPTAEDHAAIVDALRSGDPAEMTRAVARHFEDLQRSLDTHTP
ncbi:GntR family transcriptional regulator [Mycolicibacterium arabiense]|uniref:GntR family transcriptional regulator n=1 Tax=Mycolicibacterium arabiense TaxID=1286181 RepID=A0A7I7S0A4_9MYCO|nr:FadR/GntR family transcriptional regulator [Mycolicibacterium arabiense]MCV7371624.1 FadR family transcriptional regulator [Mycolicibacterium arabiense]BBY50334.1 GntR family transcriptional regulator [Mycolicibacterium arabiense]